MTSQEHVTLFDFIKEQRIFNTEQREFNRNILDKVDKIERGVYGDKVNGTMGLIERQGIDEQRIGRLEAFRNKFIWVVGGALAAIEIGWEILKRKLNL